jgi:hypothetical protein
VAAWVRAGAKGLRDVVPTTWDVHWLISYQCCKNLLGGVFQTSIFSMKWNTKILFAFSQKRRGCQFNISCTPSTNIRCIIVRAVNILQFWPLIPKYVYNIWIDHARIILLYLSCTILLRFFFTIFGNMTSKK